MYTAEGNNASFARFKRTLYASVTHPPHAGANSLKKRRERTQNSNYTNNQYFNVKNRRVKKCKMGGVKPQKTALKEQKNGKMYPSIVVFIHTFCKSIVSPFCKSNVSPMPKMVKKLFLSQW